jgi:hypothetical protein
MELVMRTRNAQHPESTAACRENLKEDAMRRMILLGAISLLTTAVVAADNIQPLDVKTGLWQVTMATSIQGMGGPQTHTYKSCVTKENLNQYPFADPDNNCKYKVQSSTGSHMDVSGSCLPKDGGKADFKIQLDAIDSEDVQGTGQLTLAGPEGAMHGDYSGKGKWIGAGCPAGMR